MSKSYASASATARDRDFFKLLLSDWHQTRPRSRRRICSRVFRYGTHRSRSQFSWVTPRSPWRSAWGSPTPSLRHLIGC